MDSYNGLRDLLSDVNNFNIKMGLHNVSYPIRCRNFPIILKENAHKWYKNLPDGSIYNFAMLAELFKVWFITSIPSKRGLAV